MEPISYFFGDFRLDVQSRELWRGEQLIMLAPRAFGCLAYLAQHRDRAVGRDELISAVWERTNIAENLLVQTIARLRTTLGDSSEAPRLIRTVPRFGYRWVAQTEQHRTRDLPRMQGADGAAVLLSEQKPASPSNTDASIDADMSCAADESTRRPVAFAASVASSAQTLTSLPLKQPAWYAIRAGKLAFVAIAAVVVVLAAFAIRGAFIGHAAATRMTGAAPVIVLPLAGEFEDEQAWMRLGVMDFVVRRLRADGVTVMPSETTLGVLGGDHAHSDTEAIRRALPEYNGRIVQLSAQRVAVGWRIEAALSGGKELSSVFDAQSETAIDAARLVTGKVVVALGGNARLSDSARDASGGKLELIQKVDAALLAEKMEVARALISSAPPEIQQLPEVRFLLVRIEFLSGHVNEASTILQGLRAATNADSGSAFHAEILNALAAVEVMKDNNEAAREQYDAALSVARMGNDDDLIGKILIGRGAVRRDLGLFDDADHDFAEARALLEKVGDKLLLARLDTHVAIADMTRGRPAYAAEGFQRAIDAFGRYGAPGNRIAVEQQLFELRYYMLDHAAALSLSESLLSEAADAQNPFLIAGARFDHCRALFALGRTREAAAEFDALEADPQLGTLADLRPRILAFAAQLAWDDGDAQTALTEGRKAWPNVYSDRERGRVGRVIAAASHDPADIEALREWAKQGTTGIPHLYVALAEADAAIARGDAGAADKALRAANTASIESGMPAEEVEVARTWMPFLIQRKDLSQASLLAARVARWSDGDFKSAQLQLEFHRASGNGMAEMDAFTRARRLAGERTVQ